jgi:hypothetical protein
VLHRKKNAVKQEHKELAENGGAIKSKNMSFYDSVFAKDETDEPENKKLWGEKRKKGLYSRPGFKKGGNRNYRNNEDSEQ